MENRGEITMISGLFALFLALILFCIIAEALVSWEESNSCDYPGCGESRIHGCCKDSNDEFED